MVTLRTRMCMAESVLKEQKKKVEAAEVCERNTKGRNIRHLILKVKKKYKKKGRRSRGFSKVPNKREAAEAPSMVTLRTRM